MGGDGNNAGAISAGGTIYSWGSATSTDHLPQALSFSSLDSSGFNFAHVLHAFRFPCVCCQGGKLEWKEPSGSLTGQAAATSPSDWSEKGPRRTVVLVSVQRVL